MAGFTRVAQVADIPVGEMRAVTIDHQKVLLIHTEEGFFALADECSHDSEPLNTGHLKGNHLVCARHGARFDIRSGEVITGPAVVGVETYNIRIENSEILISID